MRNIKSILVTGGSGFIGWNFCELILEKFDIKIVNIDNLTYASKDKIFQIKNKKNYQFYKKDICDVISLNEIIDKYQFDAIIHFAAETHVDNSINNSDEFIKTNIIGTHNLIKICNEKLQQKKLSKDFLLIHISTDEVFGHLELNEPAFTENSKYKPKNPYSATKASADHLVKSFIETYHFPAIILRCCNNYGPYQHQEKLIPKIINNIINQKPIPIYGEGKQIREWIFAKDFANAIIKVLKKGKIYESYNIGSSIEFENIKLTHLICNLMDQKLNLKKSSKKLINFVEDRPGHDFRYAINSSKIYKELNFKAETDIEQGLNKTIDFFLKDKQIKIVSFS